MTALVRESQRAVLAAASQSWCFSLSESDQSIKAEINRFSHNCATWRSVRDCHTPNICLTYLYLLLLCKAALLVYCFDLDISSARFLCFCTGNSTENKYNKCVFLCFVICLAVGQVMPHQNHSGFEILPVSFCICIWIWICMYIYS